MNNKKHSFSDIVKKNRILRKELKNLNNVIRGKNNIINEYENKILSSGSDKGDLYQPEIRGINIRR